VNVPSGCPAARDTQRTGEIYQRSRGRAESRVFVASEPAILRQAVRIAVRFGSSGASGQHVALEAA
jgi:hypothetical protein